MPAQSACLSGANRLRRASRSLSPAAALGCLVALAAAGGCRYDRTVYNDGLAEHVLPPPGTAAAPPIADAPGSPGAPPTRVPDAVDVPPPQTVAADGAACPTMSLSEAIATAFRLQPRLRVYLEGVEQGARRGTGRLRAVPAHGGGGVFGRRL